MTHRTFAPILLALACTAACTIFDGSKGADQDTMIGGEEGASGEIPPDPDPVEDHGLAQFCVDRAVASGIANVDDIQKHELWYHPMGRSYINHLDLSDKPSPMSVALACTLFWPHYEAYDDDAQARGGSPSCLSSGYHLQVPWIGTSDFIDPGHLQFPYSRDIVVGTVGNPPQAGRHTWAGPACCPIAPQLEELATDAWEHAVEYDYANTMRTRHADCAAYVVSTGVHSQAAGYTSKYDKQWAVNVAMRNTVCVSGMDYNVVPALATAVAKLGSPVNHSLGRLTDQYPSNVNYDWAASLGLVSWDQLEAFGATIDAVIKALLTYLYLPPSDFEHARYGVGGGCSFATSLMWDSEYGMVAGVTCPIGYYADFPDFTVGDDVIDNGVVGACILDGVNYGDGSALAGIGEVASPASVGGVDFVVHDDLALGAELSRSVDLGVTPELVEMLTRIDGSAAVLEGDTIAWWSTPWEGETQPIDEALRRTIGYDVDDLVAHTGWSPDEAKRFVDAQPIAELGDLVDGLPEWLAARPANTMRAHNTWRLRVERGDQVMFLTFVDDVAE